MNYERAFKVIASYVDASVNTFYSEDTRVDYLFLSYWFKQVIEYKDKPDMANRYVACITNNEICHSFGMFQFLVDNGFLEVRITSAFNA